MNYCILQDYPLVKNPAADGEFGLEFPANQYDFETQHQTAPDIGDAQWNSDSDLTMFNFPEDWATGNEGNDLNDVFGYGDDNNQHQHSTVRWDEQAPEQLITQRVSSNPPPFYQPFQQPISFIDVQENAPDAHNYDYQGDATLTPPAPSQTAEFASARGNAHKLAFRNLAEAEKAMISRHLDEVWSAPTGDTTIPTNDEERATYVAELLEAMKDTSSCSDKSDAPAFISRWTPDAINAPDPAHMEKVCWQLVDVAERLHIDGPASLPIYDKLALATARKSRLLTFAERMSHLSALLRLSKSRCFSLLKGENVATTVASPAQRCSGTIVNCVQNGKRQEFIKEGRPLWKDKNAAAKKKKQPVDTSKHLRSNFSRNPGVSGGQVHTEDAHQDTPVSFHAPSLAPISGTRHTHIGSVNGGATLFGDLQLNNTHNNSQRGDLVFGQFLNNHHVNSNLHYAGDTRNSDYTGVSLSHPSDVLRSSQPLKRTAGDAQLELGAYPPAQRPRFGNLVRRSDQV